ncbi:MAG TPA: hypothetical protein VFZ78_01485 [Flavisolibacter sp.]
MYTNVWSRYLPIIRIVMKRSLVSEQVLALNAPDFERAGMTRKSGYKFSFGLKNGRLSNVIIDLPPASGLATVLLEDPVVRELIRENEFHFTLSPKYELTIRHIPQPEAVETADAETPEQNEAPVS